MFNVCITDLLTQTDLINALGITIILCREAIQTNAIFFFLLVINDKIISSVINTRRLNRIYKYYLIIIR